MTQDHLTALLEPQSGVSDAPCDKCGYNGVGYYQPDTHPCAKSRTIDNTIKSLVELVISLEGALKFYAEQYRYTTVLTGVDEEVAQDMGRKAREALSAVTAFRKGEK